MARAGPEGLREVAGHSCRHARSRYVILAVSPIFAVRPIENKLLMEYIVNMTVHSSVGDRGDIKVTVHDQNGGDLVTGSGQSGVPFQFNVDNAQTWSPDTPTLYNLTITLGDDVVESYTGFRTIEKGVVNGITRHLLNGEVLFAFGTLE